MAQIKRKSGAIARSSRNVHKRKKKEKKKKMKRRFLQKQSRRHTLRRSKRFRINSQSKSPPISLDSIVLSAGQKRFAKTTARCFHFNLTPLYPPPWTPWTPPGPPPPHLPSRPLGRLAIDSDSAKCVSPGPISFFRFFCFILNIFWVFFTSPRIFLQLRNDFPRRGRPFWSHLRNRVPWSFSIKFWTNSKVPYHWQNDQ